MKDYTVLDGQITCLRNKLYDEAYQRGYEDKAKEIRDGEYTFYEKGLNDAWECVLKIGKLDVKEQKSIFGTYTTRQIALAFTVQQAMQKIKDYEKRQTEEINVGDEVKYIYDEPYTRGVVTYIDGIYVFVMWEDGSLSGAYEKCCFKKTGRHFPQIVEVVEQMRKESK